VHRGADPDSITLLDINIMLPSACFLLLLHSLIDRYASCGWAPLKPTDSNFGQNWKEAYFLKSLVAIAAADDGYMQPEMYYY
jgi:hypothetical protein